MPQNLPFTPLIYTHIYGYALSSTLICDLHTHLKLSHNVRLYCIN